MKKTHEHWASSVGFIMATAGSAVGLGSLWLFPYVAGENGGGAFVLMYLLFTFLIGMPIFMAELIIGRRSQKSAVLAYSALTGESANWKILGWLNVLTSLIILSYYSVVSGWCLSYIFMSLNKFTAGKSSAQIQEIFTILSSSSGINIFWLALFLLINFGIIISGVRKGIEHWSKILMPFLFIFLIALFIHAVTMPGFSEAVKFVFYPDFNKLTSSGILSALGMALFTLSVGLGVLITYGSYMQKDQNIPYNGIVITIMTVFVSLIAALTIFPIVFTFNFPPSSGPGLVFKTLPVLFDKLPATILISAVFFSLLFFAALTSTISLLEVLVANFIENFNIDRLKAAIIASSLAFIIGIPSALTYSKALFPTWSEIYGKNFFDTMNYITSNWFMPIAAIFITILAGWTMKKEIVLEEFSIGTKSKWIVHPWFFFVKWIAPIAVIIVLLQETGIINFNR